VELLAVAAANTQDTVDTQVAEVEVVYMHSLMMRELEEEENWTFRLRVPGLCLPLLV
jgi:hypothetical protein